MLITKQVTIFSKMANFRLLNKQTLTSLFQMQHSKYYYELRFFI